MGQSRTTGFTKTGDTSAAPGASVPTRVRWLSERSRTCRRCTRTHEHGGAAPDTVAGRHPLPPFERCGVRRIQPNASAGPGSPEAAGNPSRA